MDKVNCPTFILHGLRDRLIPIDHAYQLKERCAGPTFFLSPPNMTHNDFNFYDDLIRPLMRFLCQINILQNYDNDIDVDLEEPRDTLLEGGGNIMNMQHNHRRVSSSQHSSYKQRMAQQDVK